MKSGIITRSDYGEFLPRCEKEYIELLSTSNAGREMRDKGRSSKLSSSPAGMIVGVECRGAWNLLDGESLEDVERNDGGFHGAHLFSRAIARRRLRHRPAQREQR